MFKILLSIALLASLIATSVGQQKYYVDGDRGNDFNDGKSTSKAWKTLAKVNQLKLEAGDELLFKSGTTYNGQLVPQGEGSIEEPIRIATFGGKKKARINGEGVLPATIHIKNSSHMVVENLEITNTSQERQPRQYGILLETHDHGSSKGIILRNLYVHDVNGSLVKSKGGAAAIQFNNGGHTIRSRFEGLLIENCQIKNCGRNGIMGGSDYWNREGFYPNQGVIIRNNLLEGVPGDGIVPIGCDGCIIEHNVMRDCPQILPDTEAAAGIWPWSCDNTIIRYNEVSDHKAPWDGQGFDSDYNCYNTTIEYNYSHDNEGGFLLICDNGDSKMPWNVGNKGTIVRYNISINDGIRTNKTHVGIFSPVVHISGPTRNTQFYNNILFANSKNNPIIDRTIICFDTWGGYPDSTYIANNIFFSEEKSQFKYAKSKRHFFENNLYYGDIDSLPNDMKAIMKDPLFKKNPQGNNSGIKYLKTLLLLKKSPAKGAGTKVCSQAIKDFFGNDVNIEQPSIGAVE